MPRTYGQLFQKICDFQNILTAHAEAEKGKRYRPEALAFRANLESNLISLREELIWGVWVPQPLRHFTVTEPKARQISAPCFRDRVVHHAIVRVIEPLFERKMLPCSFACRRGMGTHAAADQAEAYLRDASALFAHPQVLKGDVHHFFASVDHEVMKKVIRRTIRCPNTLSVLDRIIDAGGENGVGLPIGALTSQLFANVLLDGLDHYEKETIRLRRYLRYMDDFVAVGPSAADLREILTDAGEFLERMRLSLNPKSGVFPASQGLDFCGYRIWATHRLPRKRNVRRMRRRLSRLSALVSAGKRPTEALRAVWASFCGYMAKCSGRTTMARAERDMLQKGCDLAWTR